MYCVRSLDLKQVSERQRDADVLMDPQAFADLPIVQYDHLSIDQQVIPEPKPGSGGGWRQATPVCSTTRGGCR